MKNLGNDSDPKLKPLLKNSHLVKKRLLLTNISSPARAMLKAETPDEPLPRHPQPPRPPLLWCGWDVFWLCSQDFASLQCNYHLFMKPHLHHILVPSNVMVKLMPPGSSWQLLFLRCSLQVLTVSTSGLSNYQKLE